MGKILFLHGFYASGSCVPALALNDYFRGKAEVLAPDLPMHPDMALALIADICQDEHPKVIVGNSCGSFLGQIVASRLGLPALLGNPYFEMTKFLEPRCGSHQYKSPRKDGNLNFTIDQQLINEFAVVQATQFAHCSEANRDRVWGVFGERDTLAHYEPMFLQHYTNSSHFPGAHTPTEKETKTYYAPLVERLMQMVAEEESGY